MHLGVGSIQEFYFILKGDIECRNLHKLFSDTIRILFSLYQLYIMFKYSNVGFLSLIYSLISNLSSLISSDHHQPS